MADGEERPSRADIVERYPACADCRHLLGAQSCAAFPELGSIPRAITEGRNDHREPVRGDHGVQFELHPAIADGRVPAIRGVS